MSGATTRSSMPEAVTGRVPAAYTASSPSPVPTTSSARAIRSSSGPAGATSSGGMIPAVSAARPFLIGEQPGPTGDAGGVPLSGRPARVLCRCMGLIPSAPEVHADELLLMRFETVNLLPDPGPWDRAAARARAAELTPPAVTVLLGRRVSDALGLGRLSWFRWAELGEGRVILLPHPSGLNRLYNDEAIRSRVGQSLWEALRAG